MYTYMYIYIHICIYIYIGFKQALHILCRARRLCYLDHVSQGPLKMPRLGTLKLSMAGHV